MHSGNSYTKDQTLVALAARTVFPFNTAEMDNVGYTGVVIDINVTVLAAGNIVFTFQFLDPASGLWVSQLVSATITAPGRSTLTIDPRIATAANVSLQSGVRKRNRIYISGTTSACTFSVYGTFLP